MKYTVTVAVSVEFDVEVDAATEAEAEELAEDLAYTEYLTAEPDELNATVLCVR